MFKSQVTPSQPLQINDVKNILGQFTVQGADTNIIESGAVTGLDVAGHQIKFVLSGSPAQLPHLPELRDKIIKHLVQKLKVKPEDIQIVLTNTESAAPKRHASAAKIELPGVKNIIAVGSGKGGVGKSTTTWGLALALQQMGHKVGLLDADVYGPSVPTLLGISGPPQLIVDDKTGDKKIVPAESGGLKAMSVGLMIPPDKPMIWRGPLVMGAVQQMLRDVDWGNLDYLMIDLPPGTGDVQLTLCQQAPLTGAVIVSTPQDLALMDARKALRMFEQLNVPVLGIIENMSYFECPNCHHTSHIFAHGGAAKAASEMGVPFLGEIPLQVDIRAAADCGSAATMTQMPAFKKYADIADRLTQPRHT